MTKVILAIDGSQPAQDAAEFLCRLPLPRPLEVVLLSNVFVPSLDLELVDPLLTDFREHQEMEAEQYLAKMEALLGGCSEKMQRLLVRGDVGHSIVEAAEDTNCDLIVMGATGRSGIGRILLGSVSDYVATHANCSVLVARKPLHAGTNSDPMKITVGYNDGEGTDEALNELASCNWCEKTQVSLLGVVPYFQGFSQDLMPNIIEYRTEQRVATQRHLEKGRDQLRSLSNGVFQDNVSCDLVETEHVGEAIVSHLDESKSDLVVLGDSHRSRISRLLLGSVSKYVLQHSPCSVWIARKQPAADTPSL